MKPTAARLLLLNGAPAYRRLAGIIAGVAVGVGMLLILLGAFLQLPERESRAAWTLTIGTPADFSEEGEQIPRPASDDAMLAEYSVDTFDGRVFEVLKVATTDTTTVDFPAGLARPAPGQFYASPALARLIESTPADQLADRWGEYLGEIPASAVKGPSQLVVLAGAEWSDLDAVSYSSLQTEFRQGVSTADTLTFQIVIGMGAIALLVPITLFISIVSALGAADRRERFATARLIGAGRRAVSTMSGAEMALASIVGATIGVGVAAALRPLATQLSISGATMTPPDLTPSLGWTIAVVVGIGLLSGTTAYLRSYRDDVGALGATREREEKPVTAWRALMLAVGLVLFGGSAWGANAFPEQAEPLSFALLIGFALIAFGIVLAGPWVTKLASQAVGARTSSAAAVVAAGRLQRHPRATFRSVAGLIVAVFVVSVFAGGNSAIELGGEPRELPGRLNLSSVVTNVESTADAEAIERAVTDIDGVDDVVFAWVSPNLNDFRALMSAEDARAIGATEVPEAPVVAVDIYAMMVDNGAGSGATLTPPTAEPYDLDGLEAMTVVVQTDGQPATMERVRTAVINVEDTNYEGITRQSMGLIQSSGTNAELAVMAYLGMGLAIAISALALTVATVAAVLDRRRTFGLLRLGGMPVSQLRVTTVIEAAVPLAVTVLGSAGLGWLTAWVVIETQSVDLSVGWPDERYWWALAASIAVAALSLVSTFGAVRRSTELESTRFE